MYDDDGLEHLQVPAERSRRVPTGRYPLLINTLQRLVVDYGVSVRAAALVFGLKPTTLSMRLSERDAFIEREIRDFEIARQALIEEIKRGTLPVDEFWEDLPEHWQDDLRSIGITPSEAPEQT